MEKFTIGDEVMVMRRKCNTPKGRKFARKTGIVDMIAISRYDDGTREAIATVIFGWEIVPLLQSELKIIKYKYMNNTPRPTTVKQDITEFLSNNKDVVNPLVIAKATRRKLSSIRRELSKMIKDNSIIATYDKKGFYTSIKLNVQGIEHRMDIDHPSEEERNKVLSQIEDMKIPYTVLDPNKDAVEQNESVGNKFYQSESEDVSKVKKDGFWASIKRIFS